MFMLLICECLAWSRWYWQRGLGIVKRGPPPVLTNVYGQNVLGTALREIRILIPDNISICYTGVELCSFDVLDRSLRPPSSLFSLLLQASLLSWRGLTPLPTRAMFAEELTSRNSRTYADPSALKLPPAI